MEILIPYEIGKHVNYLHSWRKQHVTDKNWYNFEEMGSSLGNLAVILETLEIAIDTAEQFDSYVKECNMLAEAFNKIGYPPWKNEGGGIERTKVYLKIVENRHPLHERLRTKIPVWINNIEKELLSVKIIRYYTNTSLNPEKILEGAEAFLDKNVWNKLSQLQKDDLNDGCKCLSLKLWTPSAMITVRAIEEAVRQYYQKETKLNTKENFGSILKELSKFPSSDKILIGYLKYIKNIRNKLQHPDARFNQKEAEEIFQHAMGIMRIIYS